MRVFVTGATGLIGSAVVRELIDNGHEVTGLARSDQAAATLEAAGAGVHRGALDDLDSLRRGAAAADGVIHTAYIHDFSRMEDAANTDLAAVAALGATLEGTNRPLVITTGTALIKPGYLATEDDPGPSGADAVTPGCAPSRRPRSWPTAACARRSCGPGRQCTARAITGSSRF